MPPTSVLPLSVGSAGKGFGFIAFRAMVPEKGGGAGECPSHPLTTAPGSALGSVPTVALSSAQARPLSHLSGSSSMDPSVQSKEVLADHGPLATAVQGLSNR